jgi:hypothetical protein
VKSRFTGEALDLSKVARTASAIEIPSRLARLPAAVSAALAAPVDLSQGVPVPDLPPPLEFKGDTSGMDFSWLEPDQVAKVPSRLWDGTMDGTKELTSRSVGFHLWSVFTALQNCMAELEQVTHYQQVMSAGILGNYLASGSIATPDRVCNGLFMLKTAGWGAVPELDEWIARVRRTLTENHQRDTRTCKAVGTPMWIAYRYMCMVGLAYAAEGAINLLRADLQGDGAFVATIMTERSGETGFVYPPTLTGLSRLGALRAGCYADPLWNLIQCLQPPDPDTDRFVRIRPHRLTLSTSPQDLGEGATLAPFAVSSLVTNGADMTLYLPQAVYDAMVAAGGDFTKADFKVLGKTLMEAAQAELEKILNGPGRLFFNDLMAEDMRVYRAVLFGVVRGDTKAFAGRYTVEKMLVAGGLVKDLELRGEAMRQAILAVEGSGTNGAPKVAYAPVPSYPWRDSAFTPPTGMAAPRAFSGYWDWSGKTSKEAGLSRTAPISSFEVLLINPPPGAPSTVTVSGTAFAYAIAATPEQVTGDERVPLMTNARKSDGARLFAGDPVPLDGGNWFIDRNTLPGAVRDDPKLGKAPLIRTWLNAVYELPSGQCYRLGLAWGDPFGNGGERLYGVVLEVLDALVLYKPPLLPGR